MKTSPKEGAMLIRFAVDNLFSFGELVEFTSIPNNRLKTLKHHKYKLNDIDILKISSIYGANGAGKSNLIIALQLLQALVLEKETLSTIIGSKFKLRHEESKNHQVMVIEFFQEGTPFYYGIKINNNKIATEELYLSGLGKRKDKLIYERKTDKEGKTELKFSKEFEDDEKNQMLKTILLEEFVKPNKLIFKLLSQRDNKFLKDIQKAFRWFSSTLIILSPHSRYSAFAHRIEEDEQLKEFAEKTLCSFDLGITSISTEKKKFKEFFGDRTGDYDYLLKEMDESPNKIIVLADENNRSEAILIKEDDEVWVKELKLGHKGHDGISVKFSIEEESDGTIRLIDFIPAFLKITSDPLVFIIDEIERSIHPLMIKELISKFSLNDKTKGQLIFTTHESNLLDQDIFRQDEIWFAEKNMNGETDLYSLSDFNEHKTIDIRKGYLSGRYGSIPFLGNLKDLNWCQNAIDK